MKIKVIPPSEYLSDFVKCFWTLEKGNSLHIERLFPCGELQFIFHYGTPFLERNSQAFEMRQPEFLCCGQFTKYRDIISKDSAGLFGVVFHPYSITSFFNLPASEISHNTIDLECIGKVYKILGYRLQDAKSTSERVRIIEAYLLKNLSVPNKDHFNMIKESINYISNGSWTKFQIDSFVKKFFVSERQFERVFNKYVGLSPRTFSGIIRFTRALKMIESSSNLTDVSFNAGYYDQSQFVHAFKDFTGYTPGEYRSKITKEKMSV
ncbi:MAG: helix-turn-helix domain-containing protein [Bacteroidota bacterium]|nr:helix-turn-helix domain-containing protein [Bacteroidota bacterium]